MCNRECNGCPWAFTEESEMIQNYGCLPTPQETLIMRTEFGKTWTCHSNPKKPCIGTIKELRERGLPYKVLDKTLITESSDFLVGFGNYMRVRSEVDYRGINIALNTLKF